MSLQFLNYSYGTPDLSIRAELTARKQHNQHATLLTSKSATQGIANKPNVTTQNDATKQAHRYPNTPKTQVTTHNSPTHEKITSRIVISALAP
jgi:hypothetical protein